MLPGNTEVVNLTAKLCLAVLNEQPFNELQELITTPGFNVNAKAKSGYPPIYYAIKMGNLALFNELVKLGADLHEVFDRDSAGNGVTLRDIAQQQKAIAEEFKESADVFVEMDTKLATEGIQFNVTNLEKFAEKIKRTVNSQSWLIDKFKREGYEFYSAGYCYGVAHVGVQALLLEERDSDNNLVEINNLQTRLERMHDTVSVSKNYSEIASQKRVLLLELAKDELNTFTSDEIMQKGLRDPKNKQLWLENQVKLSKNEIVDLEIPNFLDTVDLYQQAYKHKNIIRNQKINDNSLQSAHLLPILSSAKLDNQGGMFIADKFTGVYTKDDLTDLMQTIKELADTKNYNSPIAIQMSANRHAITVGYDPRKREFLIIDANYKTIEKYKFANEVSASIRPHLYVKDENEKCLMKTNIFSTGMQASNLKQKIIDPLRASATWDKIHTLTEDKINYKSPKGDTLKIFAEDNGDLQLLQAINLNKNFFQRNKKALIIAGGIAFAVLCIVGGVLTAGALPLVAAVVAGTVFATLAILGGAFAIGAALPKDEHKIHKLKAKPFERALKEYKDVSDKKEFTPNLNATTTVTSKVTTTTTVQKELVKTSNPNPILSQQKNNKPFLLSSSIPPILTQKYDADSHEKSAEFRNAYMELNPVQALNLILEHQDVEHVGHIMQSWSKVLNASTSTPIEKEQATQQLHLLENLTTLMKPCALNDSHAIQNFKEAILALDWHVVEVVLLQYQSPEVIDKIRMDFEETYKTNKSDLVLLRIDLLKNISLLMKPYDLEESPAGKNNRTAYRNNYQTLPSYLKEILMDRYQNQAHIEGLAQGFLSKSNLREFSLLTKIVGKKEESKVTSNDNPSHAKKLS